ncbi:MAG: translation elongation factor Ts [Planctomycetota bacterium]
MGISAQDVKALRDKTGCGMMDCKEALTACDGDQEKAIDHLRKKGIAKAGRRTGRATSEGAIGSYVHAGGKIGVLVELACETDFVAQNAEFQSLLKELCMQVAAAAPIAARREELPADVLEREKAIYREQVANKPANVIDKIVEGKMRSFYQEACLLEQPWIRDPKKAVQELISEHIAKLGENIVVQRFVRFQLGEDRAE